MPHYGVRMHVQVKDNIGKAIWFGGFEADVYNFVSKYLTEGMVFLDIGANVGLFTLVAATRVGCRGHVYAFEPSPREAQRLHANIALNGLSNVTVNQVAVTDTTGVANFAVCDDNFGVFNAVEAVNHPSAQGHVAEMIEVTATSLDAYIEQQQLLSIDLVKIDVEGSELA